jgi:hypothetical protein
MRNKYGRKEAKRKRNESDNGKKVSGVMYEDANYIFPSITNNLFTCYLFMEAFSVTQTI